jgi:hypothetical protein
MRTPQLSELGAKSSKNAGKLFCLRKMFDMAFCASREVKNASAKERNYIAGATGSSDLSDKSLIGVTGNESLSFTDRLFHNGRIEVRSHRQSRFGSRKLDGLPAWRIIGDYSLPKVCRVPLESHPH